MTDCRGSRPWRMGVGGGGLAGRAGEGGLEEGTRGHRSQGATRRTGSTEGQRGTQVQGAGGGRRAGALFVGGRTARREQREREWGAAHTCGLIVARTGSNGGHTDVPRIFNVVERESEIHKPPRPRTRVTGHYLGPLPAAHLSSSIAPPAPRAHPGKAGYCIHRRVPGAGPGRRSKMKSRSAHASDSPLPPSELPQNAQVTACSATARCLARSSWRPLSAPSASVARRR